jgi:hypothetical protein
MLRESDWIVELAEAQSEQGAFRSTCYWEDRQYVDWNGFATAQVVRALRGFPESEALAGIREKALDFLEQCEERDRPGAFRFWPNENSPDWIKQPPPADVDDTAICSVELARYGRLDREQLLRTACSVLQPYRLRVVNDYAPPWLCRGAFLTWLQANERMNVIDCAANTNVIALFAYARLTHLPGYREACALVQAGIQWAADSLTRARSIVPFYPDPLELRYAVEYAVECGAEALQPSLAALRQRPWAADVEAGASPDRPICSSAYGAIVWTCDVLQKIRQVACRLFGGETVTRSFSRES